MWSNVSDHVSISLGINTIIPSDESSIDEFMNILIYGSNCIDIIHMKLLNLQYYEIILSPNMSIHNMQYYSGGRVL